MPLGLARTVQRAAWTLSAWFPELQSHARLSSVVCCQVLGPKKLNCEQSLDLDLDLDHENSVVYNVCIWFGMATCSRDLRTSKAKHNRLIDGITGAV